MLRRLSLAIVVLAAVMLIVASPLALLLLDSDRVDWNRLSSIGQSYGAISAILSAAAVGGVVVTFILQNEQSRDSRRFAVREVHRELLRMAIDRPALAADWGQFPGGRAGDPALIMYTNLVLNYLVLLYETDTASAEEIQFNIGIMANSQWMQTYWAEVADIWRIGNKGRRKVVVDLIDEGFRRARSADSSDSAPPD
jgi:hypothetical protein